MIMRRPVAAFICVLVFGAVSASVASAQDPAMQARLSEEARARMAPLGVLVGEWEGSGWYRMGQAEAQEFAQRETVRWAAGAEVLVIDGLGKDGEGNPVHQAFAMVSWDPLAGAHVMHAYSAGGGEVTDTPYVSADSLVWGFAEPRGGRIRFTIHVGEDAWREVGEYSPDGTTWYRFLEMGLRRRAESGRGRDRP
jgi:hypothetical protein